MRTIAFIVNGDLQSAMGQRAREFASRLSQRYDVSTAYRSPRKIRSIVSFFLFLVRLRPTATYVFDVAYSGVIAAFFYKLTFRNSLIIETGDAVYELMRSTGNRGKLGLWLTRLLEIFSFHVADRLVVRGSFHQRVLSQQGLKAEVIQDGVDTQRFTSESVDDLRRQYKLDGLLTFGLVGSSVWSEKLQMCCGWELVETLRLLKDKPVKGIMIGNGSGLPHLQARCREYGIDEQIVFLDYVPYEQLPRYLSLIDVCLSTQTNDLVGQVRTTGKLPLYLAAGRYILASNVGEAALVLDKDMLVNYEGVKDGQYPRKLAERITRILECPEILGRAASNLVLAQEHFDYSILSERLHQCLNTAINARRNGR